MWYGLWNPAFAGLLSAYDLGTDHDQLRQIMAEAETERLAAWGTSFLERAGLHAAWHDFMGSYDILVSPTLAATAFPLEQFAPDWLEGTSLREQVLDWLLTYRFNMLNNPAISIPAGFTDDGRPVGFQISARHWEDTRVLGVARVLEMLRPWADRRPDVPTAAHVLGEVGCPVPPPSVRIHGGRSEGREDRERARHFAAVDRRLRLLDP